MKLHWKKCPSVTGGGKPFFWTATRGETRYWVVWHREFKAWVIEDNYGAAYGNYSNPKAAMKYVEEMK